MEKSEGVFEIEIHEGPQTKQLIIRPEDTTDGIPIYHCYSQDGTSICELRQETAGEWVQLWGSLSADSVERIGAAIATKGSED